jgi:2-polyprenyl-3-methyl-5-hydroxy-6-metoxy-1,4-benzoquinol methylase
MDSLTLATLDTEAVTHTVARRVTCLLPIWGLPWVKRFLTVALPTWLAPGNLPAVAAKLPAEMVLLTAREDEIYLRAHPAFRRLEAVLPVRLQFIDHLITGNNYSTTITLAYTEAVREAGPDMLETCFMFLVGDYIVADGSFGHIIDRMLAGCSGILVGNFQVIEEDASVWLQDRIDDSPTMLALAPRQLVDWGLAHLHPATLANIVNFGIIRNAHTNRMFWRVDGRTMIGRFFLMHMICIRPETTEFVIGASCDYSFIPEMCPSGNVEIITDSDSYLVIEMQPRNHETGFLRAHEQQPARLARSLSEWTTARHRRNAETTVVFHGGELPATLPETIAAADDFLGRLGEKLSPVPKPHRNHPYWKGAIASFREATGAGLTLDEKLFALGYIKFEAGLKATIRERLGRVFAKIFGLPPKLTRWHPQWADYAPVFEILQEKCTETAKLMLVSESATVITTWLGDGGERFQRLRPSRMLTSPVKNLAPLRRVFDVCLVELSEHEAKHASRIMARVEPLLRDGGTLIVSIMPRHFRSDIRDLRTSVSFQLSQLMRPAARALSYEFVPLNRARRLQRNAFARLLRLAGDSPWLGYPAALLAVPPLLVLGWLGNLATKSRRGKISERPISSALVAIEIDAALAAQAEEFNPRDPGHSGARERRSHVSTRGTPAAPRPPSNPAIKGNTSMSQSSMSQSSMSQSSVSHPFAAGGSETREPQYQRCLELQAEQGLTSLGLMTSQVWEDDPRRLTFLLARYKFVSKMLSGRKSVAELGCGDGFGSRIVMQEVGRVTAYDFDTVFIQDIKARRSARWPVEAQFHDILLDKLPHVYDGIYSLDVIEHIPAADEDMYLLNLRDSLSDYGVLIIGSPSLESQPHASPPSKAGHVNCKSGDELKALLEHYFHNVFLFSMNDEVVHTGYAPMAHYLFAICCQKKRI